MSVTWPQDYDKVFRSLDQDKLRESNGVWYARCAAHDDRTPSMTLRVGDTGCLLIKCHRNNGNGCHLGDILAALGCTTNDIFPEASRKKAAEPRQEAVYAYRDEQGALLFQAVRYRAEDGSKRYLQRKPNPDLANSQDVWVNNITGVRRVLYRLPQILAYQDSCRVTGEKPTVYVPEGEACVDALVEMGLEATTNSGGCGKFALTEYSALAMCDVVVLPDNDARDEKLFRECGRESWAGQGHAEEVCRLLYPVANSVKYVDLPGSPIKGDAADWWDYRKNGMAADDARRELEAVAARTPCWVPPAQPHPLFAAAETQARRKSFVSVKSWQRAVEDAAADVAESKDWARMREAVERLTAVSLAGAEAFLGAKRPTRSLPVAPTEINSVQ